MKNISLILYLILSGCFKSININKYNSKEYNSNEESSSKEENNSKKENKEEHNLEKVEDIKEQNLIEAIISKDELRVIEALNEGADVNYINHGGNTPLLYAARNCNESIVEILLKAGADISVIPIFDNRISGIPSNFKAKLLELLMKKDYIDVNSKDNEGRTFLNSLCYSGSQAFLKYLNKNKFLQLLISKNADLNTRDIYGNTPLLNLANQCLDSYSSFIKERIIGKLVKFGADINIKDNEGNTVLILAARNGNPDLVKRLLKLSANTYIKNDLGEDALIVVTKKIIELFEDRNNINYLGNFLKCKSLIKNLAQQGADVNVKNNDGDTPLILAAKNGNLGLVKILLKLNVNINVKNNLGEDALISAMRLIGNEINYHYQNRREIFLVFKKLLKFASLNLTNTDSLIKEGLSAINSSYLLEKTLKIIFGNPKFVKFFLYEGNRPNIARILQIQNLNIDKEFKNKIMRKIDEIVSLSHSSIFEEKELLMEALFSYDTFIFRNKGLLIDAFLNIVKLYKLKEDNDVKELNELLLNSLTNYYKNKTTNKEGYEKNFLKKLAIVKSKIKELLMEKLLSYDTFIFGNKGLLIDAFLNIVKLYNLKEDYDLKEINELLLDSIADYCTNKTNNKKGYEKKFLKKLDIIKSKIDVFVSNLYNRIKDNSNSNSN